MCTLVDENDATELYQTRLDAFPDLQRVDQTVQAHERDGAVALKQLGAQSVTSDVDALFPHERII